MKVINTIKSEIKETLKGIELSQKKREQDETFDIGYDRDEGWCEGLKYALSVINRKIAISKKGLED
tara:strand:+ start:789 stop:986 length:198 start_codon:yes stop_codon:yes gene_type:complete